MTFMERIDALCRERNISLRKMERDAGIGQGATTKWRQGAYLPANQSLRRLAEYFDVSIDYLVGDDAATTSGVLSARASRDTADYDSGIVETPKQSMVRIPVLGRIAAGTPTGAVEEVLGLPDTVRAFAIFPYGYPAEERTQQDRFDESRIHYIDG